MKIKTKQNVITLLVILIFSILLIIETLTSNFITKEIERIKLVEEIKTSVFNLNFLVRDYSKHDTHERAEKQFYLEYNSGLAIQQKAEEEEEEKKETELVKDIIKDYGLIGGQFSELVQTHEKKHKLIEAGDSQKEIIGIELLEDIKLSQLLITSHSSISSAAILEDIAFERRKKALELNLNLTYLLGIILLIIITSVSIRVSRSISIPIKKLHQATEELEKRNFSTRVDIKTNDELEQLGESFNKTVESLGRLDEEHKQIEKSKTQFIAISSHELRSPMTIMKANLQMLQQDYFGKLNQKQKDILETVLINTNRLDNIIVDLLEISRINAARLKINPVKTDFGKEVKNIVEEMANYLPAKKIKIVSDIGKLPLIETDPDRISQVLRNLIDNAKKFSPNNSKVFISAELKGKTVQFSIKDQGIGISSKSQKNIFEPFFQAEQTIYREYKGNGLGLAICKGIVEALGGKIWFKSDKGKGSTFYFTVPIKQK